MSFLVKLGRWLQGSQTICLAGALANAERSNDCIWHTSYEMEFLNGLKAQPLELLVGKVCQKKKREAVHCTSCCCWSVSMYVCVSVCVFPLSWLKAKLLGRKPRTLARGSLFHILLCMGTPPSPRLGPCNSLWLLTRSFCQEVVLCCQSEMWLMWNHFIGREQMFYRPLRRRVPFPSLWTLFCFPRAFSLFLP